MEKRGEDFVDFVLKADAPDYISLARGRRYQGTFERAGQPFRATRGEWTVYLNKTGFFELATPAETKE